MKGGEGGLIMWWLWWVMAGKWWGRFVVGKEVKNGEREGGGGDGDGENEGNKKGANC